MNRLRSLWIGLRASLWFVPSLIMLMTETEKRVGPELVKRWPRLLGASAVGTRAILASIATFMVTVPLIHSAPAWGRAHLLERSLHKASVG